MKKQRILKIVLILVVLIVAARLALPYIVLKYLNRTLAEMPGYRGHVEDVNIALLRGAYQVDSIYLNKHDSVSNKETPFFAAQLIDLSVEWRSLFKGEVVGELVFHEPTLRFTKDRVEVDQVKKRFNRL